MSMWNLNKNRVISIFAILLLTICLALPALGKEAKLAKNITSLQAFDILQNGGGKVYLIDVRTPGEYQQIGHPQMAYNIPFKFLSDKFVEKGKMFRGKKMKKTRYQYYKNSEFSSYMKEHFKTGDTLLIMCRSGNRSVPASDLLVQQGFKNVFNVINGFEGGKLKGSGDKEHALLKKYSNNYARRGFNGGWKYYGLPWTYTMNPKFVYESHKK